MFKRLSEPTGALTDNVPHSSDTPSQIVRRAILVHAGPNKTALTFQSGDGPISFDEKRIQTIVDVHNKYLDALATQYGGADKIPMGAYEPILDSHESDTNDRVIGRLTGRLIFEIRDVPKVGKNVPCAIADPGITFLGNETVEKVHDGRIYHLSIGISETTNRLGETSTVVKPAAPGAMLLKQGKPEIRKGSNMSVDIKRMKAHTEKLARLSAMQETFGSFTKKLVATQDVVRLTARKGQVTHRLSEAMRGGKMTPAEYKNMVANDGLTKLASLDDATLAIALMPIEAREKPVVHVGQVGSTAAADFSTLGKDLEKRQFKRLRSEFASDFKKLTGKELKAGDDDGDDGEKEKTKKEMSGPVEKPFAPGKDDHAVPGEGSDEKQLGHHLAALKAHLENGDLEGAKKAHEELSASLSKGMKHMSEFDGGAGDKSGDQQKNMGDMQKQLDELQTQMSRMGGMVQEMMAAETEEGKNFGETGDDPKQVAG